MRLFLSAGGSLPLRGYVLALRAARIRRYPLAGDAYPENTKGDIEVNNQALAILKIPKDYPYYLSVISKS